MYRDFCLKMDENHHICVHRGQAGRAVVIDCFHLFLRTRKDKDEITKVYIKNSTTSYICKRYSFVSCIENVLL